MSMMLRRHGAIVQPPSVVDGCVINNPPPTYHADTGIDWGNVRTVAIEVTVVEEIATNGPIACWTGGFDGTNAFAVYTGNATSTIVASVALTILSGGVPRHFGLSDNLLPGRYKIVFSKESNLVFIDNINMPVNSSGHTSSIPNVPLGYGGRNNQGTGDLLTNDSLHQIIFDSLAWNEAQRQQWQDGTVPNTGGQQRIVACPYV